MSVRVAHILLLFRKGVLIYYSVAKRAEPYP